MSGRVQVVIAPSAMHALACTSTRASSVGAGLSERYPIYTIVSLKLDFAAQKNVALDR
jgi:hypothetical protein